jgi:tetratricopeptide (TPR) repeat protein
MMDYGYLRLDPALPPYLAGELDAEAIEALRGRWAAAMMQLVNFLYGQAFKDAQLSFQLTLLELPNLLALLDWLPGRTSPEQIVDTAGSIEQLLAQLGRPAALARAVAVRTAAAQQIGAWSHARYLTESANVDRLLQQGELRPALQSIQALLELGLAGGETAFPGADYDIAMIYWRLGRVLERGGQAAAALDPLADAQRRFQALADAGNASAARMASAAITEQADCLTALGRLDEAADAYQRAIDLDEKRGDMRDVATGRGQLGTVRMLQERYADALAAFEEARAIFERLGEPASVATAWHQIGVVRRQARQFEAAERSYRQSLAIKVQQGNRAGQASSLNELGNLYSTWGRPEQAVAFYRQAADIAVELGDLAKEGIRRSNIADTLRTLGRTDEARREILRSIECAKPYGHAAEPWKTFAILHDIEQAAGNSAAAAAAWRQARDAYLAYRRDGGYAQTRTGELCEMLLQAIQRRDQKSAAQIVAQAGQNGWNQAFVSAGTAIATGSRNPGILDDPALEYDDSAELLLLLERLGGQGARS